MRDAFGLELLEIGEKNENLVVLTADLAEAVKVHHFAERFPERFFQMGVAESDMIGTAAGFALDGKIPIATTFAIFATSLANQPMRLSVGYNGANVKVCVSHGGVTVGPDGATHQAFEDLALMRLIPGMTVIIPADSNQARLATHEIIDFQGPVYMRLGRIPSPVITSKNDRFTIGKAQELQDGQDIVVFASGLMVAKALEARETLSKEHNISAAIVNIHTIKPLDDESVIKWARRCNAVVTAEEHSVIGGLGGAISELLAENYPVPIKRVGIMDTFGESGEPEEIMNAYGLTTHTIVEAALSVVDRKRSFDV